MKIPTIAIALGLLSSLATVSSQEWLDEVDRRLRIEYGWFRTDLSGSIDVEAYTIDQRPPAIIVTDDDVFIQPRLSLFLDTQFGEHFYSLVQFRADRGFDPGLIKGGEGRFDEYLLRYTPWTELPLHIQVGKFATVFGNWVSRHQSWDNPFINAPLPYENLVAITDQTVPGSKAAFLSRRNIADNKPAWLPVIWGPSYTTGASIFGSLNRLDYAVEVKNSSLSSRPAAWDGRDVQFDNPTVSGRIGYRPQAAWNLGVSASGGPYLLPEAEQGGLNRGEYLQWLVGHDISWAWHHWQLWGEAFFSRFEVPNVGDADTVAYYLEAKYKWTASVFTALRWNQQFFLTVPDGAGGSEQWDHQAWRIDSALGWRFNRHFQAKLQYSYSHQQADLQQGEQMWAAQLTARF